MLVGLAATFVGLAVLSGNVVPIWFVNLLVAGLGAWLVPRWIVDRILRVIGLSRVSPSVATEVTALVALALGALCWLPPPMRTAYVRYAGALEDRGHPKMAQAVGWIAFAKRAAPIIIREPVKSLPPPEAPAGADASVDERDASLDVDASDNIDGSADASLILDAARKDAAPAKPNAPKPVRRTKEEIVSAAGASIGVLVLERGAEFGVVTALAAGESGHIYVVRSDLAAIDRVTLRTTSATYDDLELLACDDRGACLLKINAMQPPPALHWSDEVLAKKSALSLFIAHAGGGAPYVFEAQLGAPDGTPVLKFEEVMPASLARSGAVAFDSFGHVVGYVSPDGTVGGRIMLASALRALSSGAEPLRTWRGSK